MNILTEAWEIFLQYDVLYLSGIKNTLLLALTGTLVGLVLGFLLASLRQVKVNTQDNLLIRMLKRILSFVIYFYIEFVRGTPMVAQAVFVYYGLRSALGWTPLMAGFVIVSFNTAAYMSEIIRSGIQSIDSGQAEAGMALGMSTRQIFISIIMPQAIRNAFPAIGNEFIVNIKDTSMLNVIMVTELFFQGMSVAGATYNYSASMLVIAVIYFILTFSLSNILKLIENRMRLNSQEVL